MNQRHIHLKMLVFHETNHVVWLQEGESMAQQGVDRIPHVTKDLDYIVFDSVLKPSQFNWVDEFKRYRLIKPFGVHTIEFGDLPGEYAPIVKLARAKCYAMFYVLNKIAIYKEKLDLFDNPLLSEYASFDSKSQLFQQQLNLSKIQADKLLQFKQDELKFCLEKLALVDIEAELMISNCKTVTEVKDCFRYLCNRLMMYYTYQIESVL